MPITAAGCTDEVEGRAGWGDGAGHISPPSSCRPAPTADRQARRHRGEEAPVRAAHPLRTRRTLPRRVPPPGRPRPGGPGPEEWTRWSPALGRADRARMPSPPWRDRYGGAPGGGRDCGAAPQLRPARSRQSPPRRRRTAGPPRARPPPRPGTRRTGPGLPPTAHTRPRPRANQHGRNPRPCAIVTAHRRGRAAHLVSDRRSGGERPGPQALQHAADRRPGQHHVGVQVQPRECPRRRVSAPQRGGLGRRLQLAHADWMARGPSQPRGVVGATVADDDGVQLARLEAREQRVQTALDDPSLVVGRNHHRAQRLPRGHRPISNGLRSNRSMAELRPA